MNTGRKEAVPKLALLLSLASLWVPVVSSSFFPEWTHGDLGILIWLLALIPPFLLSTYRGWKGASMGLASAMAAFSIAQAVVVAKAAQPPSERVMLAAVVILIMVTLGSGWTSSLLRSSLKRIQHEALTDSGTGLPNRRHALLHLEKAFARARRGNPLSVVIFDLDRFKQVNDRFGHAAGDEVLLSFAHILGSRTRAMDLSARFGGEEFLAVLEECGMEGARLFAEEVRRTLAEQDRWGRITVSAGVAEHEEGMAGPDGLVAAADQALYRAKNSGRNRVCWAGQETAPEEEREERAGGRWSLTASPLLGSGELILVVDDDPAALRGVSRGLRRFGYSVLEAGSLPAALEIARGLDGPLDLLVTDVVLPPDSGLALADSVMEFQPDVKVVFMSGYTASGAEMGGLAAEPSNVFLEKPFSLDQLASSVHAVLDARQTASGQKGKTASDGPEAEDERRVAARAGADGTEEHIGVLASDEGAALATVHQLKLLGYTQVRFATSSAKLLRGAGPPPDLIVCDLGLGGQEDLERLDAVRLRIGDRGFLPVLAIVEETSPDFLWRSSSWGTFDYVKKPYHLPELGVRVGHLLRLRKEYSEERRQRELLESRLRARSAELASTRTEVLLRLARAAEFRDDITGLHAERVGILAGLIAGRVGLSESRRLIIEQVAPLHDIGKVSIPDSILNKPGTLTPAEREVMRSHTVVGARLLSGSRHPLLVEAEAIARSHHERWDGGGYPDGLTGEEIPLSARIVAVADVFDSLTHVRPYREANSQESGRNIIVEGRGTHFDPTIADAFLDLARSGDLSKVRDPGIAAAPDARPAVPPELADDWIRESSG